ncbi:MAG: tetratricopeptide repeat protein [Bacteroidota bacterium]
MLRRLLFSLTCLSLLTAVTVQAQDADWSSEENLIFKRSFEEAIKQLRPKVSANPDDPYGYYLLGTTLIESGDFESAEGIFTQGMDVKKRFALNHVGMARVYFAQKKGDLAAEKIERAMYYDKGKDVNVKFAIAQAYLDANKLKDAEVLLRQAQMEADKDPRSYVMLGDYEYARGVSEFAKEQYQKAIEIDPTYIPAYTRIGELKINEASKVEGEEEDAVNQRSSLINEGLKFLNTAIDKDPSFAPSYQVRGDLMMRAGRYDQGKKDYEKYLELTKNDLSAELNYGKFLFLSENYQEAIDQFNSIDTVTGVKLRLLGMSHQKLGNLDEAENYMGQYFEMKAPEFRIADDYETYGKIFLDKEEYAKADEYFEEEIKMNPAKADIFEKIAEDFHKEAVKIDKAARKELIAKREATKEYKTLQTQYNKLKEEGAVDQANQIVAALEEKVKFIKGQDQVIEEIKAQAPVAYKKEAIYRGKALEKADPKGLAHFYKYGLALYKSDQLEEADKQFVEASKLKNDYSNIWLYRFQIAQKLEARDTSSQEWFMKAPAEEAIEVYGSKAPTELQKNEKSVVLAAYSTLAFYYYGQEGKNDCEAAKPYIEKAVAIDPSYSAIKDLSEYCDAVSNSGKR